jgi:hypothetical protein
MKEAPPIKRCYLISLRMKCSDQNHKPRFQVALSSALVLASSLLSQSLEGVPRPTPFEHKGDPEEGFLALIFTDLIMPESRNVLGNL